MFTKLDFFLFIFNYIRNGEWSKYFKLKIYFLLNTHLHILIINQIKHEQIIVFKVLDFSHSNLSPSIYTLLVSLLKKEKK